MYSSVNFDESKESYNQPPCHEKQDVKQFVILLNFSVLLYSQSFLILPDPGNYQSIVHSIVMLFPKCHMNEIVCSLLTLASSTQRNKFEFIYVLEYIHVHFFLLLCIFHCIDEIQLVSHSPVERHLGLFEYLEIMNKASSC